MCLAIYQGTGEEIETAKLHEAFRSNSDGGGYAFIERDTGLIQVRKGLMTWEDWWESYAEDWEGNGDQSPFILHFRIGTHGLKDAHNTHPFWVNDYTVMAHNGIISSVPRHKIKSDTQMFIDHIVSDLPRDWLDNPAMRELVADYIGASKLVFLTVDPKLEYPIYLINESKGHFDRVDGEQREVWFSNYSYRQTSTKSKSKSKKRKGSDGSYKSYTTDNGITHIRRYLRDPVTGQMVEYTQEEYVREKARREHEERVTILYPNGRAWSWKLGRHVDAGILAELKNRWKDNPDFTYDDLLDELAAEAQEDDDDLIEEVDAVIEEAERYVTADWDENGDPICGFCKGAVLDYYMVCVECLTCQICNEVLDECFRCWPNPLDRQDRHQYVYATLMDDAEKNRSQLSVMEHSWYDTP